MNTPFSSFQYMEICFWITVCKIGNGAWKSYRARRECFVGNFLLWWILSIVSMVNCLVTFCDTVNISDTFFKKSRLLYYFRWLYRAVIAEGSLQLLIINACLWKTIEDATFHNVHSYLSQEALRNLFWKPRPNEGMIALLQNCWAIIPSSCTCHPTRSQLNGSWENSISRTPLRKLHHLHVTDSESVCSYETSFFRRNAKSVYLLLDTLKPKFQQSKLRQWS